MDTKNDLIPLIDIIVPTYNRKEDILFFKNKILLQKYENFKVYIIDDNSDQDLSKAFEHSNNIVYKRLDKNGGQAHARNVGISLSSGDYIISLDDDAWFEDDNSIDRLLKYFLSDKSVGCVMFNVRTPDTPYLNQVYNLDNFAIIGSHITCGCAYRREVLEKIGGFSSFFHSGAEETDISLKIYKSGYKIIFSNDIKVFHNYLPKIRPDSWYYQLRYNTTRNDLLIVLMHYPTFFVVPYFFGKYFSHIKYSFLNKRQPIRATYFTIKSLGGVFQKLSVVFKLRRPMDTSDFKKWIKIRW